MQVPGLGFWRKPQQHAPVADQKHFIISWIVSPANLHQTNRYQQKWSI
jgi:hypothetical protein